MGGHLLIFVNGLVLTPIVIKISGPEAYGNYVLLLSYLGIIFGISSMGVGTRARRWLPSCDDRTVWSGLYLPQFTFQLVMVSTLAVLSMVVFAIAETSGHVLFPDFHVWLIPAYLVAYVLYSQGADYFRYTHRVGTFNAAIITYPYLFIGITLLIYYLYRDLNSGTLFISMTLSSLLVSLPLIVMIRREIGLNLYLPKAVELKADIALGFPLVLTYLVDTIMAGGDRYIIAAMMSVRDVGMYAPAYAIASLPMVLPKVFGVVLPPLLSRMVDNDDVSGARQLVYHATRAFLLVSIPFSAGSVILGRDVLVLYTNPEVAAAAWMVIPIVALGTIFYGLTMIYSCILFVRLKTTSLFRINTVAAVINISLNLIFLYIVHDIIMSAIATLLSYFVCYILLARHLKFDDMLYRFEWRWLFLLLSAAIAMCFIVFIVGGAFANNGLTMIGVSSASGLFVYAIILRISGIIDEEYGIITSLIIRARTGDKPGNNRSVV